MEQTVPPQALDAAAVAPQGYSFTDMILHADPVVQIVMALLVLASVGCWAIVFEKTIRLGGARRAAKAFETAVKADVLIAGQKAGEGIQGAILAAAAREKRDGMEAGESRSEFRIRLEIAMRQAMAVPNTVSTTVHSKRRALYCRPVLRRPALSSRPAGSELYA